jgi:hypothetical protein
MSRGDAMSRVLPVLLPLFVVAGCDGGVLSPGPPGPAGPPGLSAQVKAGFPRGGVADTIQVDAIEPRALRAAELVVPDGPAIPASTIDVVASPRFATGQWAAGDPWRNALSEGGASTLTLPHAEAGAALQGEQQLLATVSSAEIALPDPVAYRRDWARYRIRLTFGTPPGEVETRVIAAPEPPPEVPSQGLPQRRTGS